MTRALRGKPGSPVALLCNSHFYSPAPSQKQGSPALSQPGLAVAPSTDYQLLWGTSQGLILCSEACSSCRGPALCPPKHRSRVTHQAGVCPGQGCPLPHTTHALCGGYSTEPRLADTGAEGCRRGSGVQWGLTVTGESTLCTLLSSTKISLETEDQGHHSQARAGQVAVSLEEAAPALRRSTLLPTGQRPAWLIHPESHEPFWYELLGTPALTLQKGAPSPSITETQDLSWLSLGVPL